MKTRIKDSSVIVFLLAFGIFNRGHSASKLRKNITKTCTLPTACSPKATFNF